jgi:two-component system, cell cycle response regulator DivK
MYRILYVEDEMLNSRLVKKMLKPMNCEIIDAETATQGLQAADEQLPDVILMDVNLPDLSGYEATRKLKQSSLSHIPVIILTADTTSHTEKQCIAAGCDAFLNKPVSSAALIRAIQQVTHQAQLA